MGCLAAGSFATLAETPENQEPVAAVVAVEEHLCAR